MVSKGWVKKLLEETKQWVSEGLISHDQEARISSRYSGRMEYSRLINTITTLGSILIGLGILLFVASNWDKLGRPAKIAIIFLVITCFNLASFYFRNIEKIAFGNNLPKQFSKWYGVDTSLYHKKGYPGLGEGFLLIGAFSFGAGIWLIAQIYQIHYNFSAGIMFWILGILPAALIYRSWTVLSLSSILSIIWFSSYTAYYVQRECYGFLFLCAAIVWLCYRLKQRFPLFVMMIGISVWLGHFWFIKFDKENLFLETSILTPQLLLVTVYACLGFILYGLGLWQAKANRFAAFSFLYKFIGVLFITLPVYSLSFAHHYYKYSGGVSPLAVIMLVGTLLVMAAAIFLRLLRLPHDKSDLKEIQMVFYFLISVLLATLVSLNWPQATSPFFNIILLAETLGFMYLGFLKHSEGIFRLSIAIFFLNVLSRYFDIFWKMMPRSLLFIFGGILLIAGAVFAERKRREIESLMRQKEGA